MLRKILALLSRRERWQLAGLSGMVVLMGLAQVVGVGSIAPFVSVVVNPESVQTNQWLRWTFERFGFDTTASFLVFLAVVVVVAMVVASGFLALTQWMLIRFAWVLQHRLSKRLLEAYMVQPYAAFLGRNSAETGKNVLSEVERLTDFVVLPLLRMIAVSVAALFVLAALFWANAGLTLAVIVILGGGYGAIFFAVRRTLTRAGQRRIHANTERFKTVSEAFGGIKETKVLGREAALLDQYNGSARRFAAARVTEEIIVQLPRYALEVLAVGVVLLLALLLIGPGGDNIQSVAPLLAMYAFAAQRLLPFLQQIYASASQLRFNSVVISTIYNDMAGRSQPRSPALGGAPAGTRLPFQSELRLDGVAFTYPGAQRPAVEGVTVSIPHRAFVAFVGSTGAGKTTLVDIILGLLQPSGGALTVDGTVLDETVIRAWQNNLGYVPQEIYLTDDSIAANIAFGIPSEDRWGEAIERAARIANMHDFIVDELPNGYDTVVGERGVRLSGGQRQRIGIARALYHDPEVLVLDEATSNLDQGTERAVHKAIEQAAAVKTVIMVAHRLSTTRHCDSLYMLDQGRLIAQGSYETLLLGSDRFRAMAESR
jgi:ABC-type bacteriocin/lantibiotic exporter with double-glycine peptidase domain